MSRPLFALALVVLALLLWLPLAMLASRLNTGDVFDCIDARGLVLLGRTAALAGASALAALAIGLPLAWLLVRSDLFGASWMRVGVALPLLSPPLLLAIAWTGLIDLRGFWAAVLVLGLGSFPLVSAASAAAFALVDARAIEAAELAGGRRCVLRLELRLALPAALAAAFLVFAIAAGDFAVCDYVSSVGPKLNVYADEIFLRWSQAAATGAESSRAIAGALPLVGLCLCALLAALALARRAGLWSRVDVQRSPEPVRLGRLRWPLSLATAAIVLAISVLPLSRMLFESSGGTRPVPGAQLAQPEGSEARAVSPRPRDLGERLAEAGRSFESALTRARGDLRRSATYGLAAALLTLPAALVVAHAIVRRREQRWARWLEVALLLPLVLPGCVVGIASISLWNAPLLADAYASALPGIAALAGRFAPLSFLLFAVALARLDPSLEEAAAVAGAGPARRLLWVVLPSCAGAAMLAVLAVYACSVRELDIAVLLPALNSTAIVRLYNGVHFARDGYVAALSLLLCATILLPAGLVALARTRRSPA